MMRGSGTWQSTGDSEAAGMGTPIRMAGQSYAKGVGVHAYSRLEYKLEGRFRRFQSIVGLDETARPAPHSVASGAVLFRVYVDGKKVAEISLSYKDPPRRLDLSVANGKTLGLEVSREIAQFDSERYRLSRNLPQLFPSLEATIDRLSRFLEARPDAAWAPFYRGVALPSG